jgi:hydroxymethylpyrimidine/phosphomethylpyrimidine kinase
MVQAHKFYSISKMPVTKGTLQVALTIAGSDPSGGAGIQADLKTFTAIGVYAGAVISSLTVQNTKGVFAIQPIDPPFVKDQITYVLSDLNVSHIKIGMLGSSSVAKSICEALDDFKGEIIYDPVLVSTSGQKLIDLAGYEAIRDEILGLCTVLTPNIQELSLLTKKNLTNKESFLASAEILLQQYGKLRSVIITGGHYAPEEPSITDYLLSLSNTSPQVKHNEISHPRIISRNTHGTGCTFSAAFTAYHLLTGNDIEAFHKATAYMDAIIKQSAPYRIGHGTGPLAHHLK